MTSFLNKLAGIKETPVPPPTPPPTVKSAAAGSDWLEENYEGQLSVDVYSTADEIVIKSTIAGVKSEEINIAINNDMLTIRGERAHEQEDAVEDYYYQECYWGGFSRSIILPLEVEADKVAASLKNGVLTIRLPKAKKAKSISIKIKED